MSTSMARKVCLIGDFSVGKTSLTRRFISNTFSDHYLTTVGVKIETKQLTLDQDKELALVVWDIAGSDTLSTASTAYVKGAAGFLLVADGTRKVTVESAFRLKDDIHRIIPDVPYVGLLNKADLVSEWSIDQATEERWPEIRHWRKTSALTGEGVEEAFIALARKIMEDA